jgi:hypothetical protein
MNIKCWQCSEQLDASSIEYVANVLMNNYKKEARTWYDLAKAAIAAVEKYDHLSRKTN